jgi:molecular chaperone DnaJ
MRGDHYITLVVETPEKLSNEAKELLKQFDALTGDSLHAVDRASGDAPKEKPSKKKKLF